MAKHRSSDVLLSQALEEVKRLQLRVAQDSLSSDPQMVTLGNEKTALRTEMLKIDRWLKVGKGGLQHRINRLNHELEEAHENLHTAKHQKEELANKIADVEHRMLIVSTELLTEQ